MLKQHPDHVTPDATSSRSALSLETPADQDRGAIESLLHVAGLPPLGWDYPLDERVVVVRSTTQEVVGVAIVEPHGVFGLLRSVAVAPSRRGQQVASLMVHNRLAWAACEGISDIYLLTTTAQDYFSRFGFVPVGRAEVPAPIKTSAEFTYLCPETAVVMKLTPAPEARTAATVEKYTQIAHAFARHEHSCCCAPEVPGQRADAERTCSASVPLSLGCANLPLLASPAAGATVLDIGCGAGGDLARIAERVGPAGKAIGVDASSGMLALAHAEIGQRRLSNVELRHGRMESLPVADGEVDLIISNCVVNLAVDKQPVLSELYRVLKPGGEIAIADLAALRPISESTRAYAARVLGCINGLLTVSAYETTLSMLGFCDVSITTLHAFRREHFDGCVDLRADETNPPIEFDDSVASIFVSARKPSNCNA